MSFTLPNLKHSFNGSGSGSGSGSSSGFRVPDFRVFHTSSCGVFFERLFVLILDPFAEASFYFWLCFLTFSPST